MGRRVMGLASPSPLRWRSAIAPPPRRVGGDVFGTLRMADPSPEAPFDDIRRLTAAMPGPDEAAVAAVRARNAELTKPPGSLGRLEWLAEWLAAWQGKAPPSGDPPLVCVFAGGHRVSAPGVSAF